MASSGDFSHIRAFDSAEELSVSLGEFVLEKARAAVAEHGKFAVAVSGGSLPSLLASGLHAVAEDSESLQMDKWEVYYVDERCVPLDSEDSNHFGCRVLYKAKWCTIADSQIHPINPTLGSADEMAADYEARIKANLGDKPVFDLVLLGMGPDGHTASLFPGHPLLKEDKKLIAGITDSPKPPSSRITFTYPLINSSKNIAVVAAGESKALAFAKVHHTDTPQDASLPLARVKPATGQAIWFVDHAATSKMEAAR